jgi:hypothetical protein
MFMLSQETRNGSPMSLSEELSEDAAAVMSENDDLRAALIRTQRDLAKMKQRTDRLVEVTIAAARDAVLAHPLQPAPKPKVDTRRKTPEHALWVLTDWQGSKVTESYNSQIMRERVQRFCDKAEKITAIQRESHPVKDCTIALGGDMVEGLFNYPAQLWEVDASLFTQFVTISNLLVETVRRALTIYERVTVVGEWGNHGRIGSKRDHVPRSDNVDRMTYELARQILASSGESRVTWEDSAEDIQRIEIGEYRALLMHGDEVGRMGFASPSAWIAAGNRWRGGAYAWDFQDIYLGHYHKHAQEPLADGLGAIYWTGSTESDNRYARDSMAAGGVPSQRLHFIDPERGRVTAQYQIWLDK